jgi:hypothetical protein
MLENQEGSDKIVVYAVYDSVIDANIIKTKLDAYGIPCFLTGENISNLYPLPANGFSGTRLHVFENDVSQIDDILNGLSAV